MIRAVLDTSVLVRAVLRPLALMGFIARGLGEGRFLALYSDAMLDEVTEVLARPRLRDKFGIRDKDVLTLVGAILQYGEAVEPLRCWSYTLAERTRPLRPSSLVPTSQSRRQGGDRPDVGRHQ